MPFGFYSKGTIIIPPLPKWDGGKVLVGHDALRQAIQRHSQFCQFGVAKDSAYVLVPTTILKAAIEWTLRSLKEQGITYGPESFDCENFVNEAHQTLCKMARLAGIAASPLTCTLSVTAKLEWATAKAGGAHAIMGTMTDSGLWVSESQNGQSCPIENYPNRSTINVADNI